MKDFSAIPFTTGTFPDVTADQSSGATVRDGAPLHADWVNDLWGAFQAMLDAADVTPSGSAESSSASDILAAIRKIAGAPGEILYWGGNSRAYAAHENRLLSLEGQVITIANYPELVDAVYIGNAYNSNVLYTAFYKTSDAGGTTRSTSGAYMVLPDCRGQFLRGINLNRVTGNYDIERTDAGTTTVPGSIQNYQPGAHMHLVGALDHLSALNKVDSEAVYVYPAGPGTSGAGTTQQLDALDRTGTLLSAANPGSLQTSVDGYDPALALDIETRPDNIAFYVMIRY